MQFRESQAIYLQIVDYACEKILLKEWAPGERIPSVRELAVQLEVNPNTLMRAYEFLQQRGIVFNQRGIGFFTAEDAVRKAMGYRRETFMGRDLPQVFRSLFLLGMEPDDLKAPYEKYRKQYFSQASPAKPKP